MTCPDCDGKGEAEYMALDETSYSWSDCHVCEGTGQVAPYCLICEATLVNGYCFDCDLPSGWQLAERSAYGMAVKAQGQP